MKTEQIATRLRRRIPAEMFRIRKGIYQVCRPYDGHQKTILFIMGCQRSGTNLMLGVFQKDLSTRTYKEFSELSSDDPQQLRLNSLDSVKRAIDQDRVPLVVLKPLVESQNLSRLLDYFDGARALWMYRDFKDVASSNLALFGVQNGIHDLRPIVENRPQNWRSENVSENVREIVREHFSEDMNPYDAAALFWFARNSFFFELDLDKDPRVMMCKYEDLVTDPLDTMTRVYEFIGHDFPGEAITAMVHASSVGRGRSIKLSPEVDLLCREMLGRLNRVYRVKTAELSRLPLEV